MKKQIFWSIIPNPPDPIAVFVVGSTTKGLCCVNFHCKEALLEKNSTGLPESDGLIQENSDNKHNLQTIHQLKEYFQGERKKFTVELDIEGTEFQKKVWNALLKIPYGSVKSYGELAIGIGSPNGSRAVGMANRANPVSIIIPCHRVIQGNGKLGGYGGSGPDIKIKRWLIDLETRYSCKPLFA